MNIINLLKTIYSRNRLLFVITLVVIALVVAGCSSQGGAPPQGPIGGGCG